MNTRNFISVVGVILILFGIFSYSYGYFTYTENKKIAEIGSLEVTATQEKSVVVPPALSALSIVGGLVLVAAGLYSRNRKL